MKRWIYRAAMLLGAGMVTFVYAFCDHKLTEALKIPGAMMCSPRMLVVIFDAIYGDLALITWLGIFIFIVSGIILLRKK